jgi:hypothetical protein
MNAEMKPGWKTTEFWLKLTAMVSAVLLGSGVLPTGSTALSVVSVVATILGALGYSYMRSTAKSNHDKQQLDLAKVQLEIEKKAVLDKSRELSLRQSVESER